MNSNLTTTTAQPAKKKRKLGLLLVAPALVAASAVGGFGVAEARGASFLAGSCAFGVDGMESFGQAAVEVESYGGCEYVQPGLTYKDSSNTNFHIKGSPQSSGFAFMSAGAGTDWVKAHGYVQEDGWAEHTVWR